MASPRWHRICSECAATTTAPAHTSSHTVAEPSGARAPYAFAVAFSGLFLLCLERAATANEAAARSSLGLAFSGAGRFWLLLFLALISTPAVHISRSEIEMYAGGGAVGALILSALLQAWILSCAPEFRSHVVAELETPKVPPPSQSPMASPDGPFYSMPVYSMRCWPRASFMIIMSSFFYDAPPTA